MARNRRDLTPVICDPQYPQFTAHSRAMRVLLGLAPEAKLPREGMEPRIVQGIKVWVTPLMGPHRQYYGWGRVRTVKSSTHRVLAECPSCGRVLSAGRLHQHVCPTTISEG